MINELYETILQRREEGAENSYTRYLFDAGLDKMLKKVGEESAEVLIAAKNADKDALVGEIGDLAYHVLVLMAQCGVTPEEVRELLRQRHGTAGNLKPPRDTAEDAL
ncbi:MAG: phosphoribosyl-ATP diphosphatase [Oscillospiraceae bacterium]|nr:phosphoribosyl-ATP diphosphatase [Oscillospiraceae bacterium]